MVVDTMNDQFDITPFYKKLVELEKSINQVKNIDNFEDLVLIWRNILTVQQQISREQVNCRRLNRATHDYVDLVNKFQDYTKNLEQMIMLAKLMD